MTDKCPDCDRPFAEGLRAYKWGGQCGIQLPRTEHNDTTELELNCCTVALAGAREKLRASEAEVTRLRQKITRLRQKSPPERSVMKHVVTAVGRDAAEQDGRDAAKKEKGHT